MFLEDVLSALSGGLNGGMRAYSWMKDVDLENQKLRDRRNSEGLELMQRDAATMRQGERDRVADQRYTDGLRREDAEILSSLLQPNQELDDATFGRLRGTPFEARVQDTVSLPSRGFAAGTTPQGEVMLGPEQVSPGSRNVRTWMPTAAQSKSIADEQEQKRFIGTLPVTARRVAEARSNGLNLSATDLITPAERAAADAAEEEQNFSRYTRRERFQDGLIRGREAARRPDSEAVDPYYARDRQEYQDYVGVHNRQQESNVDTDPVTGKEKKRPYVSPMPFEDWRAKNKSRGPRATAPAPTGDRAAASRARVLPPVTPRRAAGTPAPRGGGARPPAPRIDEVVTVRGQRVRVTKVLPNGQIEGVPVS